MRVIAVLIEYTAGRKNFLRYLRGRYYWYKQMIDGICYYRSLKIKKGKEAMLSARMAQVDEERETSWFE